MEMTVVEAGLSKGNSNLVWNIRSKIVVCLFKFGCRTMNRDQ